MANIIKLMVKIIRFLDIKIISMVTYSIISLGKGNAALGLGN